MQMKSTYTLGCEGLRRRNAAGELALGVGHGIGVLAGRHGELMMSTVVGLERRKMARILERMIGTATRMKNLYLHYLYTCDVCQAHH
jgi:hypothetical protein